MCSSIVSNYENSRELSTNFKVVVQDEAENYYHSSEKVIFRPSATYYFTLR